MNNRSLSIAMIFAVIISPSSIIASWEILGLPTDRGFTAIWAINEQTVFVSGDQGLWKTFNGKDWEIDSGYQTTSIYFTNDTIGFLGGYYITTDGGRTWQIGDTINGSFIGALSFPKGQSLIGYGLGYDYVSKTINGGWHWSELPPFPKIYPGYNEEVHPSCICFPDEPDTGYLTADCWKRITDTEVEAHRSYFKTTDGGQTWKLNEEGLWNDDFNPHHIAFPQNASVGYMAGGGKVFKTTNGGTTWDTVLKDRPHIVSMCFPETDQVGYVFGDSVAHKTTDGGKTWKAAYLTHDSTFYECHFINNRVGFVTGHKNMTLFSIPHDPGFVLKTTDGLLGIAEEDWADLKPQLIELTTPTLFSSELTVNYSSKTSGSLKASVFDASGREVRSLNAQHVSNQGTILIPGANLSSGVYFVRVEFRSTEGSENKTLRTVKVH